MCNELEIRGKDIRIRIRVCVCVIVFRGTMYVRSRRILYTNMVRIRPHIRIHSLRPSIYLLMIVLLFIYYDKCISSPISKKISP